MGEGGQSDAYTGRMDLRGVSAMGARAVSNDNDGDGVGATGWRLRREYGKRGGGGGGRGQRPR